jgi:hypothetical protein
MPSEGLAQVTLSDRRLAYLDAAGDVAILLPAEVKFAGWFSEGLALVNVGGTPGEIDDPAVYGGKWGWIDRQGRYAIEPRFTLGDEHLERRVQAFIYGGGAFKDGRAVVPVKKGWGFIDRVGKLVIPGPYDEVMSFRRGTAEVRLIRERRIAPNATEGHGTTMIITTDGQVIWRYATDEPDGGRVPAATR